MSSNLEKIFIFWSKSSGKYVALSGLLRLDGWQIVQTAKSSTLAKFHDGRKQLVCLAILNPVNKFTSEDVRAIEIFISNGNKVILANSADDMESPLMSNINDLSRLFGTSFNEDCVIRPNPYKTYHPTEAMLEDFVVNRGLSDSMGKYFDRKSLNEEPKTKNIQDVIPISVGPRIVYPQGCTIKIINKSAIVMMTSSKWALPSSTPICAFYRDDANKSRAIILGSSRLLSDKFIDKEDNKALVCSLLEFIGKDDYAINISDARTIELVENNITADMNKLLNLPIFCFQQIEPLPDNKLTLFDRTLFSIDNSKLPEVVRAREDLDVRERTLTLMRPTMSWRVDGSEPCGEHLKYLLRRANGKMEFI